MESYWNRLLDRRLSRRRALAATGATAAGAAFLAACGGDDSGGSGGDGGNGGGQTSLLTEPTDTSKSAKKGGVLKRNFSSDFPTLDPSANTAGSSGLYETVLGRLIGFKPGIKTRGQEDQYVGEAAESWETTADQLQVTFKLRNGVTFHNLPPVNGRVMDADDMVFSWERFATLGGQRQSLAQKANPNAPIISVTAPDQKTIVVKLAYPLNYAVGAFGARENINIVPKEAADTNLIDVRNTMISIGPYYLSNYERSVGFTFKRHETYYDKSIAFVDQIDYPIIPEYATASAQFRAGNLHTYAIRQEELLSLKKDIPAMQLFSGDTTAQGNRTIFGWLTPHFRDERVRQAVSMSYDRDLWIETFNNSSTFEAEGLPVERRWYSPFPSVSQGYDGWRLEPRNEKEFGENAKYFKYDVAEAKKLLAAAGYPNGFEIPSTFPAGTAYGVDFPRQVEVRQAFNNEIGITFKNNAIDYRSEFIPNYRDGSGNYEGLSYRSGPPPASGDPVAQMHYWYHSKAGASFFGFDVNGRGDFSGDPYVDDTIIKAQQEADANRRKALINELVRYLGKKMYSVQGIGGASSFSIVWPAVGNYNYFQGGSANTARTENTHWWLDQTKAPFV